MDNKYIEKFDVVGRYVQNRLSDEELNNFEVFILENPDMIPIVEQERELRQAYKGHQDLLNIKKQGLQTQQNKLYLQALAVAACFLLGVTIFLFTPYKQEEVVLQPPILLQTFRGRERQPIPANGEAIVQFEIDMGPPEFLSESSFNVEILRQIDGEIAFSESGLKVDEEGWLHYALVNQTSPLVGLYEVRIIPDGIPDNATIYSVNFSSP